MSLHHGDLFDVLPTLEADSLDACVCDPPYGLEFMGKEWDKLSAQGDWRRRVKQASDDPEKDWGVFNRTSTRAPHLYVAGAQAQQWHEAWAREVWRVLKPGAHLVAFGGTRTFHRLTCALEDAGFEIRDCLCWLYGSGFPKSLDVSKAIDHAAGVERVVLGTHDTRGDFDGRARSSPALNTSWRTAEQRTDIVDLAQKPLTRPTTPDAKQWEGWGTALKPAWEPIILARKPLQGTVAQNVQRYGTGALHIDACRIATTDSLDGGAYADQGTDRASYADWRFRRTGEAGAYQAPAGRWPANVLLDPEAAQQLDAQSGDLGVSAGVGSMASPGTVFGQGQGLVGSVPKGQDAIGFGDQGGASRFFLVVKEDECPSSKSVNDAGASFELTGNAVDSVGSPVQAWSTGSGGLSPSGDRPADCPAPSTLEMPSVSNSNAIEGSRFLYCPKPDRAERDLGCEALPQYTAAELTGRQPGSAGLQNPRAGIRAGSMDRDIEARVARNAHPTVKPLDLMRWLVRLITPPGGTVLDPFLGSGTTGMACRAEDRGIVGIERDATYVQIAEARMAAIAPLFHDPPVVLATRPLQPSLFP